MGEGLTEEEVVSGKSGRRRERRGSLTKEGSGDEWEVSWKKGKPRVEGEASQKARKVG